MAKTVAAPVTSDELREWIALGDAQRIAEFLGPYPAEELGHLQPGLRKLSAELRTLQRTSWSEAERQWAPLMTAMLMCAQTPTQAASWLTRRALFYSWHSAYLYPTARAYNTDLIEQAKLLTERREKAWVAELAVRLGEAMRPESEFHFWQFVDLLARDSGAVLPINAGYVDGWRWNAARYHRQNKLSGGAPDTLLTRLRKELRLRECVAGLFEFSGQGNALDYTGPDRDGGQAWPHVLAKLADEGLLDRGELLDVAAARLLNGDRPGSLRGYLKVYEQLAPTTSEVEERRGTYLSMATSGVQLVAKVALRELRALDTAAPFDPSELAELSEAMFARPEPGLVAAQLTWLDAAMKRDAGTAPVLLPALAVAFGHPASTVQQKTLKLLAKHHAKADAAVLQGLRDAAADLDPALKAEADQVLATTEATPTTLMTPSLPEPRLPEYQPSPMPPMPATPEELVTALAPCFTSSTNGWSGTNSSIGPLEVEQIMAAVAVLSHRNRDALVAAFQPLADRHADLNDLNRWELRQYPGVLRCLFEAVLGREIRKGLLRFESKDADQSPFLALLLRIQELTDHLLRGGDTVPVLLATPTEASGAIDPAVFEQRMAAYREAGVKSLPLDLEQAELRIERGLVHRPELDALSLAEVFAPGEIPDLSLESLGMPWSASASRRSPRWSIGRAKPSVRAVLYPELMRDGKLRFPTLSTSWGQVEQLDHWSILLPHEPDEIAAHAMTTLYDQANASTGERSTIFPQLAETAGTPGPLTHLALTYALAADRPEHRTAAQDALLILAARGLLIPELIGGLGGVLWRRDMIKGKRFLDSLSVAEQAGASAEVFAIAAAAIGVLIKYPSLRGLPDLLLLTSRCVVSAGAHDVDVAGLAGLPELAALAKPKRVGEEARRLQQALVGPIASVTAV